jgi:hypothetical protein
LLINDSPTRTRYARVELAHTRGPAALTLLRAPSLTARTGVTLGGQTFGASTQTGRLGGRPQVAELARAPGGYVVSIPPASAALLSAPTD